MTPAEHRFLQRNQLPESYLETARQWFEPLLAEFTENYLAGKPLQIIGINGSQGSGKSTLGDYLCSMVEERHDIATVCLSLDDFYLTRSRRSGLARDIHPLLATRGVPGTHDVNLAITTLNGLKSGQGETLITRFDKAADDRCNTADCDRVCGPVDLIIVEGWCFGARPESDESLEVAMNPLEEQGDPDGVWRRYVNEILAGDYQTLFAMADRLVMLRAPSFDTVFRWRLEQEQKLLARLESTAPGGSACRGMTEHQLREFIQHFQRITEHTLDEMPSRVDHLFQLDRHRKISAYLQPVRRPKSDNTGRDD